MKALLTGRSQRACAHTARKTNLKTITAAFQLCLLLNIPLSAGDAGIHGAIHIRGSATLLPALQLIAEAYMKEHPAAIVTVAAGGSARGIKAVIEGTADIGMASTENMISLQNVIASSDREMSMRIIGHDGIIPVVHPSNPVSDLSREDLKKVFSGEINNWNQLGGRAAEIIVINHDVVSGTFDVFKNRVMDDRIVTPAAKTMQTREMIRFISENAAAIGYIAMARLNPQLKPLGVDNLHATESTIIDGTYPLRRELRLYARKNQSPIIADFINYCLDPDQGQKYISATGYIPVKQPR